MQKRYKDLLRTLVRELRHKLVGTFATAESQAERGNLDRELERLGIAPNGIIKPIELLPDAQPHERYAYHVVTEQLTPLPLSQRPAVRAEIVERAAYTWINRLFALRTMEVRGLIDTTLRAEEVYGDISEKLYILRETEPERARGEDGGWWAVIEDACQEQAQALPGLFALDDPVGALHPSPGMLVQCVSLVGGKLSDFTPEESDATFADPDAIGWAYQFYQEEGKASIDAKCKRGGKVATRAELAAKTQLFTEPYMVQWLLQNSLGRSYHEAFPHSALPEAWPYYVRPEQLDKTSQRTLASLTLLDPCMGSGHFLRAAFDMFVAMYREQFPEWSAQQIADRILSHHLHGIDLDPRTVQLTALTLYLRACELIRDERQQQYLPGAGSYVPPELHLATTPTNLNKGALQRHLERHPEDILFRPLIEEIFAGLEQAEILGSLLRPREYLEHAITSFQKLPPITQPGLFEQEMDAFRGEIVKMAKKDPKRLKELALQRVIESFKSEEHNVDDVAAMLFGREAVQGVRLLQLLDRQYAVVVTNPPYLGSQYMDVALKKYVEKHYTSGRGDLYAAFILRCRELCQPAARVAMVTMQGWMFSRRYAELRAVPQEKLATYTRERKFTGLLRATSIETLAHLGTNAFEEIGGEVVQSTMFVFLEKVPSDKHNLFALRVVGLKSPVEKQNSLKDDKAAPYSIAQKETLSILESPLVYWLQPQFYTLLKSKHLLCDIGEVRQGLSTADARRFTRCFWENIQPSSSSNDLRSSIRWFPYVKGGGYRKWCGLEWLTVDWEHNGSRIKAIPQSYVRSQEFYFKLGLTYTIMAQGSFATRLIEEVIFGDMGSSIFLQGNKSPYSILALTSTHIASYLLRVTTQSLKFREGYVANLPLPENLNFEATEINGRVCFAFKNLLISQDPIESNYHSTLFSHKSNNIQAILHTIEGFNEHMIINCYKLSEHAIYILFAETGAPAGWYPLIIGYDTLPALPDDLDLPPLPQELFDYLAQHKRISSNSDELIRIKANLRALYEAGPGAKKVELEEGNEMGEDGEETDESVPGAHIPIPTETFLEELSVKMQLHPISVYWLLEELCAEGVRCKPEELRMLEDRLSVLILRLLGHRWPRQIETGEQVPAWAERSGVIPLVGGTGRTTLAERLRRRLQEEDGDLGAQQMERLLEELTSLSLEEWLRRRFFVRHVSQFKHRPVAWHLASAPVKNNGNGKKRRGGNQRKPAFECLLYACTASLHTLASIRGEFVEPLIRAERSRIERERAATQEGQLVGDEGESVMASERLRELEAFAEMLRLIEEQGFACTELDALLAQELLDRWSGDGYTVPENQEALLRREQSFRVDINDGVRVNIAPLQLTGVLAAEVLKSADARKAIADRARWRSDERCWVREGKLPRCGWMDEQVPGSARWYELEPQRLAESDKIEQKRLLSLPEEERDEVDREKEEVQP
ncbi:BREX-1 system adenine-specific DNA-methyltransferase PglX [Ktedonosporobacter rubrisoli]|uniref:site-specific DNA-methyltransferase (adenine-specific) n=1 Tax=Ktedonosporobacter rubrisoli TaxID=2509675 RepID=A0A4P6K3H0_KTERU|nr:BREX-1 system adenine-specific DNA-methyltransferase PglX [Ktedonosporobacter rubrisoli]QBD82807.1 BREX-1 system adenine-specific DNA-methyltransferase PglX [Ktedonosporobacter rubrisoli]